MTPNDFIIVQEEAIDIITEHLLRLREQLGQDVKSRNTDFTASLARCCLGRKAMNFGARIRLRSVFISDAESAAKAQR